jgi:TIMELESS-interacting protein
MDFLWPCNYIQNLQGETVGGDIVSASISIKELPNNGGANSSGIQISEEQKARMESNRLKALERAASRARSFQAA